MENYDPQLYFGSIHILVSIVMFCALLLWPQQGDGERSHRFLVWTWLILLASCTERLAILFLGLILTGLYPLRILQALYFAFYVGYITQRELYVRLFIPGGENMRNANTISKFCQLVENGHAVALKEVF